MQRSAVPVMLLVLASALTACQEEPAEQRDVTDTLGRGDQYVALGDSYTAAPGTGPRLDNACFNTEGNYPRRIAEATGMELDDRSCNGANTNALTKPQQTVRGQRPPQLDGVDERTDLVTIRLGANDFSLYSRIIGCSNFFGGDQSGTPCADADAAKGRDSLDNRLPDLDANLVQALGKIEERAPDARIIVIGYPRLVPDEGTCPELDVPADDYDYVRRVIDGLNHALEAAAATADVTFIDMYAASKGHDICADEPWIAGAPIDPEGAIAWHPYAAEGRAVAKLVLAELEE